MSDAELERTNVKIEANNHGEIFTASGEVLLFEGSSKYTSKAMTTSRKSRKACFRR